jgi:hypothetical protein
VLLLNACVLWYAYVLLSTQSGNVSIYPLDESRVRRPILCGNLDTCALCQALYEVDILLLYLSVFNDAIKPCRLQSVKCEDDCEWWIVNDAKRATGAPVRCCCDMCLQVIRKTAKVVVR